MKIGLTYDLKTDEPGNGRADLPDDLQEEFDSPGTIEAVARVLRGLGHEVIKLGDGRELLEPLLVKPAWEGSSKGIRGKCLVRSPEELVEVVASLRRDHRQPILVEEFIDGDELTVGMIGNDPPEILGVMRVLPNRTGGPFIYSLEVKRD